MAFSADYKIVQDISLVHVCLKANCTTPWSKIDTKTTLSTAGRHNAQKVYVNLEGYLGREFMQPIPRPITS